MRKLFNRGVRFLKYHLYTEPEILQANLSKSINSYRKWLQGK